MRRGEGGLGQSEETDIPVEKEEVEKEEVAAPAHRPCPGRVAVLGIRSHQACIPLPW